MYELIRTARGGDLQSQEKLYFWGYIWPRIVNMFEAEREGVALLSGTPVSVPAAELVSILAVTALSPQPEPPDRPGVDPRAAIGATKTAREKLLRLSRQLDEELAKLEGGRAKG